MNKLNKFFLFTLFFIGIIWIRSSFGKLTSGNFVQNLGGTLEKFASKNPHLWWKSFLADVAVPNSAVFGNLVLWGEVFVALSITLVCLGLLLNIKMHKTANLALNLGLVGGFLMNLTFYFASGWISPSTESLNLLMMVIQAVGLVYILREARQG